MFVHSLHNANGDLCDRMVVVFTTTYAVSAYHHFKLWVRIPLMLRCTPDTPVFSANKTVMNLSRYTLLTNHENGCVNS